MEDLINYVSQKSDLPPATASAVTSATLDYLEPHCSQLLKSTIEVMLNYPHISGAQQDLLIAVRVLFPHDVASADGSLQFDD